MNDNKNKSLCLMAVSVFQAAKQWLNDKYAFRLNTANNRVQYRIADSKEWYYLQDEIFNSLRVQMSIEGVAISADNLRALLSSCEFEIYDPYKSFFESLPMWDGEDHIDRLAKKVVTDDQPYFNWCFKKWLVASVASLCRHDIINHTAIILAGEQGKGKTTFLNNIVPKEFREYCGSGYFNTKSKDVASMLEELAFYNMDEVENLKKENINMMKEILTRPYTYARAAYRKFAKQYSHRCNFCGTANGLSILNDPTGNRRFLCHYVKDVYAIDDIDLYQVYAQAYHLFRCEKFQFWFDKEEQKVVEQHNVRFRAMSMEEELILSKLDRGLPGEEGVELMQCYQILETLHGSIRSIRLSPEKIGKVLTSKGFIQKKCHGGVNKYYVKWKTLNGGTQVDMSDDDDDAVNATQLQSANQ